MSVYFSYHSVKHHDWFGLVNREGSKLRDDDCQLDSPLRARIVETVHRIFLQEKERYCSQLNVTEKCDVEVVNTELTTEANYLSYEMVVDTCDGSELDRNYTSFDTDESRLLWDQLKDVIAESATFDTFETKIHLDKWLHSPIVMVANIIKNIKNRWTDQEIDSFLERALKGINEIKLAWPMEFISLVPDNFIKCDLIISASSKEMMEVVECFLDSFERKLVKFSRNGDPNSRWGHARR